MQGSALCPGSIPGAPLHLLQTHDPDLYRVARQGRFGVNGSLVFPQFVVEPANQVEKEIKAIRTPLEKNGMDFGFVTSYNAALRMIVDLSLIHISEPTRRS